MTFWPVPVTAEDVLRALVAQIHRGVPPDYVEALRLLGLEAGERVPVHPLACPDCGRCASCSA